MSTPTLARCLLFLCLFQVGCGAKITKPQSLPATKDIELPLISADKTIANNKVLSIPANTRLHVFGTVTGIKGKKPQGTFVLVQFLRDENGKKDVQYGGGGLPVVKEAENDWKYDGVIEGFKKAGVYRMTVLLGAADKIAEFELHVTE
ncbi:MAG: hypothetical protein ACR2FY_04990 [Pirellulaceae bacterium]